MLRILRKILKGEAGQAFPIVLALLVIGGLTIVPSLNLTFSSAKTSHLLEGGIKGTYAADAGVEETLWSLANSESPPTQLSDDINDMQVNIQVIEGETYTLYLGEFIEPGDHSDYLDVTGNITWDSGENAYKYTITVAWQPGSGLPTIHLVEVGARIPIGYSYKAGSAADFTENLSTDEPGETLDSQGAYLLNWDLGPPYPYVSEEEPVQTQTFYITGAGEQENHYAWVVANRDDIGAVGEITGTFYEITATAIHPESNKTTAKIIAKAMIGDGNTHIISWQIHN
ncbi:MAG: hypothetical protein WBC50_07705 [Dehalococcoidales bacterium]